MRWTILLLASLWTGAARAEIAVCFTPAAPCEARIVAAIARAGRQIRMQAYAFTARPIAAALIAARDRGVDVQIMLDRSNEARSGSQGGRLVQAGIPVWVDDLPAIAHDKDIIIDGSMVIGGSYNYTAAAAHRNVENVLFIGDPDVARQFLDHWSDRRALARPWAGRAAGNDTRPPNRG